MIESSNLCHIISVKKIDPYSGNFAVQILDTHSKLLIAANKFGSGDVPVKIVPVVVGIVPHVLS